VQEFKYLGLTLSHTGKMTIASNQMARSFAGVIARVWRICSELGIKNRKHAMLWILPVFALSAGLYGCQAWATKTDIQIIYYNQSPHPPRFLSKDAVGCETKHKRTLPSKRDMSAAPVLLLVPLCCSLLEQPFDKQQCLAEQDQ